MCLEIKEGTKPVIAEKDIIVFKNTDGFADNNIFHCRYRPFSYGKDALQPKETIRVWKDEITTGYHSFINILDSLHITMYKTGIFVIPKGSMYYTGLNNGDSPGIVSDQIIYKGRFSIIRLLKVWISTLK